VYLTYTTNKQQNGEFHENFMNFLLFLLNNENILEVFLIFIGEQS